MAKILISPLGVGRVTGENEKSVREYKKARYKIENKQYEDSFVASALYKHLKLDEIIFIGTVKSIWEEAYRFFYEEKTGKELDGEELKYYLELADKIKPLNSKSNLNELDLSPLEKILGERSRCVLIKYGLDEGELSENFERIIQLVYSLKKGDEIYIDISNSFRSLSMFLFLVLSFIKDLAAEKEIKISGVYYGMLEVSRELGYAPIVDLKSFFEVTDWIKGGYSLQNYGDSLLIAKLLQQNHSQLSRSLSDFSQAVNIGYLPYIRQQIPALKNSLARAEITGAFKYLKELITNFLNLFEPSNCKYESEFQLELAGWYFKHQRYATGYITMTEAILTYLCEINDKDPNLEKNRKDVKSLIRTNASSTLARNYYEINTIRNNIAHLSIGMEQDIDLKKINLNHDIKKAEKYQRELKMIFNSGTWEPDGFRSRK